MDIRVIRDRQVYSCDNCNEVLKGSVRYEIIIDRELKLTLCKDCCSYLNETLTNKLEGSN